MFKSIFFCCARTPNEDHDTYQKTHNASSRPTLPSRKGSVGSVVTAKSEWTKQTANSMTHHYPSSKRTSLSLTNINGTNKGFMLANRFEVIQAIGQGSFGKVYHGKDIQTGEPVAIKILKQKGHQSYYRETSVLKQLSGTEGVPQIIWQGSYDGNDVIVLTRLGYDLSMLFEYCNHKFTLATVLKLGINLIGLMENVHARGIIHRDIKPHNFLIGYRETKSDIFVVDFGLAKTYISRDTKHKRFQKGLQPVGTARYASFWTHMGVSQSRRDDLLSIGYILVYFLKGKLPWQGLRIRSKEEKWSSIGYVKMGTDIKTLCHGIPTQFIHYIEYVSSLQFEAQPNYEKLKNLLRTAAQNNNINLETTQWDWEESTD